MKQLWISESNFIEIPEGTAEGMGAEVAVRSRRPDFWGMFNYLPDPDEVLRKLGLDMTVYRQLLTDAHVWACYSSRKAAVQSCEWDIREKQGGSKRASKKAIQFIEDIMSGLDIDQVITDMLDAPFYGMSPVEIIWKTTGSGWIPERLEGKPAEWFVFSMENALRFLSTEHQIEGEILPDMKFLLARHHASYLNPYGERLAARCFWPVAFKKGGMKYWSIFTEKFGMPWVVGRVPRMTNETDRAALLSKLVTMVQDAVAVINDDERVEFLEEKGKTGTSGIYSELIDTCNKEISKAVLGQIATTEGTPGKLGEEKGQVETKEDLIEKDKRMVASQLNLFFQWAVMMNLSNSEAPVFHWQEEEDIQADRAERDDKLKNQGVRFTKSYFTRVYGFEETDLEIAEISQGQEIPPGDDKNMPGFRSGAKSSNFAHDQFSQESADKMSREASIASQNAVSKLLEPVLSRIEVAKSFDEVGEILYGIYPDLDSSTFQDLLARAMFASAGAGYAAAGSEN
jgi:phage gp29-like protein